MTRIICGVDIASSSLEARLGRQGALTSFANNPEGIARLAAFCHDHHVELVAMEATGGYEQQAFAQLSGQGLPVAILNPRAVRRFAQSMGRLEKTDAIDAAMIAWYAEVKNSPLARAPRTQQHLRALVTRLRQLTQIRTAQLNQQRLISEPAVTASFTQLLAVLSLGSGRVTRVLERLIEERGRPVNVRSDNGPKFTSRCMLAWSEDWKVGLVHIQPGRAMQNGHVESFHGRLRDECLNASWFRTLNDVRSTLASWR